MAYFAPIFEFRTDKKNLHFLYNIEFFSQKKHKKNSAEFADMAGGVWGENENTLK